MKSFSDYTSEEWRERWRKASEVSLERHDLRKEGDGCWYCSRPEDSIYSFRVLVAPRQLAVVGDLGDIVLYPPGPSALSWLVKAFHPSHKPDNINYFMEKAAFVYREQRVFLAKDVYEYLKSLQQEGEENEDFQQVRDAGVLLERFRDDLGKYSSLDGAICSPFIAWQEAWFEVYKDLEGFPDCCEWDRSIHGIYHACRKFVELYLKEEER